MKSVTQHRATAGISRERGPSGFRCSIRDGVRTGHLRPCTTRLAAAGPHSSHTSAHKYKQSQPTKSQADWKQPAISLLTAVSFLAQSLGPVSPAQAKALFTSEENLTISIFKRNTPSVVNITNLASKRDTFTMNMLDMPQGAGSGFIWDTEGRVVTNLHVVAEATGIKVTLAGGAEYAAKVIGVDMDKDLAVLQIVVPPNPDKSVKSPLLPMSTCSSSADLVVGQKVYAIGLDHTLTTGVISGTGREILSVSGRPIQDVVQTDAAINPGNSGGPLLDSGGCLIGINTAIYSPSGANTGVGFAIPVDIIRSSVAQIIQYGKVVRPMMGIAFAPDNSSEPLGIKGILVLNAKEGGPAWKAGIKGTSRDEYGRLILGDIITEVNGTKIKNSSDLYRVLDKAQVGDVLNLQVLRADTKQGVAITLEASEA